ncbi:chaperone protein dnaJ 20, chloroplastic-like [Wolffia australiana]
MNVAAVGRRGGEEVLLKRTGVVGRRRGGGGRDPAVHVRIGVVPGRGGDPIHRYSLSAAAVNDGVAAAGERWRSFYDLLGISQDGGAVEIKKAYKDLARRYHPDVCPSADRTAEYTRRFIELQEAYETLSDPRLRALYDRDLAAGLHHAFAARRRRHPDEESEDMAMWKNRWQEQVSELRRRSSNRDQGNLSWGARMRQKRAAES